MSRYLALVPAAGLATASARPAQAIPATERQAADVAHAAGAGGGGRHRHRRGGDLAQRRMVRRLRLGPAQAASAARGRRQRASVRNGLDALDCAADDWVLVHDAARCCLSADAVERLLAEVGDDPVGGLLALPVPDTVKRADAERRVAVTVSRADLWLAQTPQMFRHGPLRQALQGAGLDAITDEASAIERSGGKPAGGRRCPEL